MRPIGGPCEERYALCHMMQNILPPNGCTPPHTISTCLQSKNLAIQHTFKVLEWCRGYWDMVGKHQVRQLA
eukprot:1147280-Pelagomonas_calceolata.AAC.12